MSSRTALRIIKTLVAPMDVQQIAESMQSKKETIRANLAVLQAEGFVRPDGVRDAGKRGTKATLWRRTFTLYAEMTGSRAENRR